MLICIKMKRKIEEIIAIPDGFNVEIDNFKIKISKDGNTLEKNIPYTIKKQDNKIIIGHDKATKSDKKLIKTAVALINNMFSGLDKKFEYKLQICSVHFPINVEVKGNEVIIKNFLGEVKERKAKILEGVEVKIDKENITVKSYDKDRAGQTAANIETATKIRAKDRRIFQDGIYITQKEKGRRQK